MRKLNCFIACAFGRSDVDKVYTQCIKKVLAKLNINALRVDKINHNDNIDIKIIALINQCDFGIADLTYARPSVYYEAGFIHGLNKDVIFTVRADHLEGNLNESLRVHFDLSTKNIINWNKPTKDFELRLSKRLKLITSRLNKRLIKNDKIRIEEILFNTTSIADRLDRIVNNCKELMLKRGLNLIISEKLKYGGYTEINRIFVTSKGHNLNNYIVFAITQSITQNFFRDFWQYIYTHYSIHPDSSTKKKVNISIIFISLTSCPDSRIQKFLPNHSRDFNNKSYQFINKQAYRNFYKSRYIFLDKILSWNDFETRLNRIKL